VKHYLKGQSSRANIMAWTIYAGDAEENEVDSAIAYLDTETLADALMSVLTGKASRHSKRASPMKAHPRSAA
jgi:hypothetical protein